MFYSQAYKMRDAWVKQREAGGLTFLALEKFALYLIFWLFKHNMTEEQHCLEYD